MMVPIRCFSCGKPIGHLYEKYQNLIKEGKSEAVALKALGLERACCKRMILTHKDLIDELMKFSI